MTKRNANEAIMFSFKLWVVCFFYHSNAVSRFFYWWTNDLFSACLCLNIFFTSFPLFPSSIAASEYIYECSISLCFFTFLFFLVNFFLLFLLFLFVRFIWTVVILFSWYTYMNVYIYSLCINSTSLTLEFRIGLVKNSSNRDEYIPLIQYTYIFEFKQYSGGILTTI